MLSRSGPIFRPHRTPSFAPNSPPPSSTVESANYYKETGQYSSNIGMANMFAPSALDRLVKDHAETLRFEEDVDYLPEWEALVDMLDEDYQQQFLDNHGGELTAIAVIADEVEDEPSDTAVPPEHLRGDE